MPAPVRTAIFFIFIINSLQKYEIILISKNKKLVFPIFASMNKLPSAFLERMQAQLNTDFDCYLTAYSLAPEPSIRLNPKKRPDEFEGLESVDWYDEGKY